MTLCMTGITIKKYKNKFITYINWVINKTIYIYFEWKLIT